ncbi:MAG: heme oxygenase (biliverdin-producing) [Symploca sp. SIO2C1]|nr:heme oxygenase (biliverdin-producing) [Symploca sp. SIO2C1]
MSGNFAAKLRERTKQAHTAAENMGFIKCFLRGTVEKGSYRKLTSNLYFVYSAMEEEMEKHQNHPVVSKIYFTQLNRKNSLEQDLSYYYGANWKEEISPSPAAQDYVDHIRQISASEPELLVAHSYTRYIGDLSGGQILKNIAQRAMNLSDDQGLAFYSFPDITDEKAFKNNYRQMLNELPIDEATEERIVDEAIATFDMNKNVFEELEGSLIKAIGQVLFNSLTRRHRVGSTEVDPGEKSRKNKMPITG